MRLRSGDKHQLRKSKSTNQEGIRSAHQTDLCFSICRFSQVVFIPRAQPHALSFFLFSIVFGINDTSIPRNLSFCRTLTAIHGMEQSVSGCRPIRRAPHCIPHNVSILLLALAFIFSSPVLQRYPSDFTSICTTGFSQPDKLQFTSSK